MKSWTIWNLSSFSCCQKYLDVALINSTTRYNFEPCRKWMLATWFPEIWTEVVSIILVIHWLFIKGLSIIFFFVFNESRLPFCVNFMTIGNLKLFVKHFNDNVEAKQFQHRTDSGIIVTYSTFWFENFPAKLL